MLKQRKKISLSMCHECPKGHTLDSGKTDVGGYQCSMCDQIFPTNTLLYSCRTPCDFDLCFQCFTKRKCHYESKIKVEKERLYQKRIITFNRYRKVFRFMHWIASFIPPMICLLFIHHIIDINALNYKENNEGKLFRLRLGFVIFPWLMTMFSFLLNLGINCYLLLDSFILIIVNQFSLYVGYQVLSSTDKKAPIFAWIVFSFLSLFCLKFAKSYLRKKRIFKQKVLLEKLIAINKLELKTQALKRFQNAVKKVIKLNFRAKLMISLMGKKEAEFRKQRKRPFSDEIFFKSCLDESDGGVEDQLQSKPLREKIRENMLGVWGLGVEVGVPDEGSLTVKTGYGFVNASGKWDMRLKVDPYNEMNPIQYQDSNDDDEEENEEIFRKNQFQHSGWKHNIDFYNLRWERRELEQTISKQTNNPKKLLKFEMAAKQEKLEEKVATSYGFSDLGGALDSDTLVEVVQVEGGTIPGYIFVQNKGFWNSPSSSNSSDFEKQPSLSSSSSSPLPQTYEVLFLDGMVERIPSECIRRLWLYRVNIQTNMLEYDDQLLKTAKFKSTHSLALTSSSSSSSSSSFPSSSASSSTVQIPPTPLSQQQETDQPLLLELRHKKNGGQFYELKQFLFSFHKWLSVSMWLTMTTGIVIAFLFDIIFRKDLIEVKISCHPFIITMFYFLFLIINDCLWFVSELIILFYEFIFHYFVIENIKEEDFSLIKLSQLLNQCYWWCSYQYHKKTSSTWNLIMQHFVNQKKTQNSSFSSIFLESKEITPKITEDFHWSEKNGRYWLCSFHFVLNEFGVELFVMTMICVCICFVGLCLSSGFFWNKLLLSLNSFYEIFENTTHIEDIEEDESDDENCHDQFVINEKKKKKKQQQQQQVPSTNAGEVKLVSGHKIPIGEIENLVGLRCLVRDRILNEYDSAVILHARKLDRFNYQHKTNHHHHHHHIDEFDEARLNTMSSFDHVHIETKDHLHNDHLKETLKDVNHPFRPKQQHETSYFDNDRLKIDVPYRYKLKKNIQQLDQLINIEELNEFDKIFEQQSSKDSLKLFNSDVFLKTNLSPPLSSSSSSSDNIRQSPVTELLIYDVRFESNHKTETGIPACYIQIIGSPPFIPNIIPDSLISSEHQRPTSETGLSKSSKIKSQQYSMHVPLCPEGHLMEHLASHFTRDGLDQRCCRCFRYFAASVNFHGCIPCEYSVCPKCAPRCVPKTNHVPNFTDISPSTSDYD